MPSFTTQIRRSNGSLRAVVPVMIGDISKVPSAGQQGQIDMRTELIDGLVDTGATITCITFDCAKRLNLTPCGTRSMTSASHRDIKTNSYNLALMIAVGRTTPIIKSGKKHNKTTIYPMSDVSIIEAGEFVNRGKGDVEVLIGMDIIKKSVMIIIGHDNRLTMSF